VIGGEPATPAAAFDFARAAGGPCCASAGDWAASASTSRPITSHPAFPGGVTRACLASRLLSMKVDKQRNWNRDEANGNGNACTSPDLSRALRRNPHLRVPVPAGRYDLGTP
jgi:hypothetical protein